MWPKAKLKKCLCIEAYSLAALRILWLPPREQAKASLLTMRDTWTVCSVVSADSSPSETELPCWQVAFHKHLSESRLGKQNCLAEPNENFYSTESSTKQSWYYQLLSFEVVCYALYINSSEDRHRHMIYFTQWNILLLAEAFKS